MSKPVKEMDFFFSIYHMDFRNLVEENELGVREDLSGKVNIFLTDPPYNVPRDQKDDHARCDVFSSKDMKDVVKVLRDVMKSGAHGHVLCSDLRLDLWYNALYLEEGTAS